MTAPQIHLVWQPIDLLKLIALASMFEGELGVEVESCT